MLMTKETPKMGMDWLNRSASVLVCVKCSALHWFSEVPEELYDVDESV